MAARSRSDVLQAIRAARGPLVAHAYFEVDPEIVWDVVATRLPALEAELSADLGT